MSLRRYNCTAKVTTLTGEQHSVRGFFYPNANFASLEQDLRASDAPYTMLVDVKHRDKFAAGNQVVIKGDRYRVKAPPPRWEAGTLTNNIAIPLESQ